MREYELRIRQMRTAFLEAAHHAHFAAVDILRHCGAVDGLDPGPRRAAQGNLKTRGRRQ